MSHLSIKISDKLVCVIDTHQREDCYEFPDGKLNRGKLYCVSGLDRGGGLLLTGYRVRIKNRNQLVGTNPARFMSVGDLRRDYPSGIDSIPAEVIKHFEDLVLSAHPPRKVLPDLEGFISAKSLTDQTINLMEYLHLTLIDELHDLGNWDQVDSLRNGTAEAVQSAMFVLLGAPHLSAYQSLARSIWDHPIKEQRRVVIFCRKFSPLAFAYFLLCSRDNILSHDLVKGYLDSKGMESIMIAAGYFCNSLTQVREAADTEAFLLGLFGAGPDYDYVACDWELSSEEFAATQRVPGHDSLKLLLPGRLEMGCLGK